MTQDKVTKIKAGRNAGRTNQSLADELGVSKRTIEYWVKRIRASGGTVQTIKGRRPLVIS